MPCEMELVIYRASEGDCQVIFRAVRDRPESADEHLPGCFNSYEASNPLFRQRADRPQWAISRLWYLARSKLPH